MVCMNIKKISIILTLIVLIGAVSLFYYFNQRASEVMAPGQTMYQASSKDGTKISYIKSGKGPVVVLVGGALQTKSDKLMAGLMPLLSSDFTVVSYDRRGRGESSNADAYAPEHEIEDLEAVIAEVGGSAYVFGNSSGGNLALIAAAKLPRIQKVAVYEAPFISDTQLGSAKEYIANLQEANTNNDPGKALKLFFKRIGVPSPIVLGMSFTSMWSGLKAVAPTLLHDAIIVGDGGVPKELGTISVPVLALTGTDDWMKLAAKLLVTAVPRATHQVLDGQTHDVKPDVLASALSKFFK